jgi:hypothetical protein
MTSSTHDRRGWGWFIAWMALGLGYALGLLGALTIGPFLLLILAVPTIALGRRPGAIVGLPGLASGLSFPVFYVAYLNRSGPGTICRTIRAAGQECVDESSPWPWLIIGAVLLVGGCVWFLTTSRHRRALDAPIPG